LPEATYQFPEGFLWGTATAAHQVEGQNTANNWSAWEAEPGRIINGDKAGLACDWWNGRWEEDLTNAARDGQNAHRFSVEWSRVMPSPDRWDESALDHYREMLKGIHRLGMTPMVTLHHFTDPLWIYEMGGWENDQTPKYFEKFVRKVVTAFMAWLLIPMWKAAFLQGRRTLRQPSERSKTSSAVTRLPGMPSMKFNPTQWHPMLFITADSSRKATGHRWTRWQPDRLWAV
jgi:hypothetical protein